MWVDGVLLGFLYSVPFVLITIFLVQIKYNYPHQRVRRSFGLSIATFFVLSFMFTYNAMTASAPDWWTDYEGEYRGACVSCRLSLFNSCTPPIVPFICSFDDYSEGNCPENSVNLDHFADKFKEVWLHLYVPPAYQRQCYSANPEVCEWFDHDGVDRYPNHNSYPCGAPHDPWGVMMLMTVIPAFMVLGSVWYATRERKGSRAIQTEEIQT